MVSLGKEIRKARIDKSWSQQELSTHTGIAQKHISALESDRMMPKWPTIARLASALDLNLNDLAWEWTRMHPLEESSYA